MLKQLESLRKEMKVTLRKLTLKKLTLSKNSFDYLANEVQMKDIRVFLNHIDKIIERGKN